MATWMITGASRGLGREIALRALDAGHTVIATARSRADLAGLPVATAGTLHLVELDITDQASIERAVAQATACTGAIDVLVNNAGQAQLGYFEMVSERAVRRQFDVNVFGPMAVTRAVLPGMRAARAGLIVTISSASGLVSNAGGTLYSASKFAVEGWIEGLAEELSPFGIRSLVVDPGMMRTDFLDPRSALHGDLPVADYAEAAAGFEAYIAGANHQQANDPAVLAAHIVALAGTAEIPSRFLFGADAQEWVSHKLARLQGELTQSAAIAGSADGGAWQAASTRSARAATT
jgi:NAD(P)-dependent dehydrogenase (short-subunit alcohol dehydrogenase family)